MSSEARAAEFVKQAAREAGFDLAGIAPVQGLRELSHFEAWIAAGYAGEMNYLKARTDSGKLKRSSLLETFPWVRSVIVGAINYNSAQPYSTQPHEAGSGWISRYAWGEEDYHDAVLRRLRSLESRLREQWNGAVDLETRCYVDTGPLVERVYAQYAGVGWSGKNTCTINQKLGSWLFLGVILTSVELRPDLAVPDRCGSCTRCIEACPTDALVAPYILDANLCISYLSIEKRGAIAEDLRAGMGRQVFGCDICQDVCPWNRKAAVATAAEFQPREELVNPALDWLATISEQDFRDKFRRSPVRRAKRSGLRRNAVVAMGNSEDESFVPALEQLKNDQDPVVADHARWSLRRLGKDEGI